MASVIIPNEFEAGTPAVASDVNENFSYLRDFVKLVAEGTNIDLGVIEVNRLSNGALNTLTPLGVISPFAGVVEPANWKFCNGQSLTIADHTALYNLLTSNGTVFRYGANPTATTFLLPNLNHRVPVGLGSETEFNTIGKTGGSKSSVQAHEHTVSGTAVAGGANISIQNAGNHAHSGTTGDAGNHQHTTTALGYKLGFSQFAPSGSGTNWGYDVTTDAAGIHSHTFSTNTTGDHGHTVVDGSHGHSVNGTAATTGTASGNLQPYVVLNYIIRVA
jgi:microcystin-dependent protein